MESSAAVENRFIPAFLLSSAIFAVIGPYLPIMLRSLGYSTILIGIMLAVFEGAGIAGPIVFGHWADRSGKYRLLLLVSCIVPAALAFPLALFVHPIVSALFLAFMSFGFKPSVSLLDAATTITIGETGNYGKIRVWGSIGYVLAVLWLQWTPVFTPDTALNIAFWISFIAIITIVPVLILPLDSHMDTHNRDNKEKTVKTNNNPWKNIISVYFIAGFILIFSSRFSMAAFYTYLPLYLTESMLWNAVGLMFALGALSEIPFILFSRKLIIRFGPMSLLVLASFAVIVRLLLLAFLPYKPAIVAAQLLHSLCFGIFYPASIAFISSVFPPEKRGIGMSLFLTLGTGLPILIGNMAGGFIVDLAGYRSLFITYAVLSGVGMLVYFILRKRLY